MRKKKGCYRNRREVTEGKATHVDDFFPTYHALTRLLLEKIKFREDTKFMEPCAGAGDIVKVLNEFGYSDIRQFDIKPRHSDILKLDFINDRDDVYDKLRILGWPDVTITNPPFKLALEFLLQCFELTRMSVFFILPLDYLHGSERYDVLYKNGYKQWRLKTVYAFERRPLFGAQYNPAHKIPTGATSFAWFEFENGHKGSPWIEWIKVKEFMGKPLHVDECFFSGMQ